MVVALRCALMVNFAAHLFNPFSWIFVGSILYAFSKNKVSLSSKILLIALYGIYFATDIFLSMFVGGMAGGAPGVPENYATILVTTTLAFLAVNGTLLLLALIKR